MQFYKIYLTYLLHIFLFILTGFTTTLAGVQWLNKNPFDLNNFSDGLPYSISLLAVLLAHELGHYFAARRYNVSATLPYFIPVPPFILNPFGTMGALIRLRSPLRTTKALFDIGIAGPIAGLIVIVFILGYGIYTLPDINYLYSIHPEYKEMTELPTGGLTFGNSILFLVLSNFVSELQFFPPMNEIYHYPYLCVGWFGLFITSLNLIPVGQLDGGHILYALVGKKQGLIARLFFLFLIGIGISGFLPFLGIDAQPGTIGWLLWAGILFFIIKLDHPEIPNPEPLDVRRQTIGWLTMIIFVISFTPIPFLELALN